MSEVLFKMLLIVLGVNVMFLLGQAAILDTNPAAGVFYNCQGGFLGQFEASGCLTTGSYTLNTSNAANQLPSGATSVSPETGVLFTDDFTGIKTWLLDSLGLGYLLNLLGAPYYFLSILNLPGLYVFSLGSMWYAFTLAVILAFLFGR